MELYGHIVDPAVVARIWNDGHTEFETGIEARRVRYPIHIHEVRYRRDLKAILAEEPLIYFDLPLISYLPRSIEIYLFSFAGCFIVDDVKLTLVVDPDIIDAPAE